MKLSWPRFTIERLRTLVLVGGILLVAAIGILLAAGKWKRHFLTKDMPKRLGIDIQQQADGVDYTQSRKGKTLFKIHAARAIQLKKDGKTLLHDVRIDLYGEDGNAADTIRGSEFEYDPGAGIAQAAGAVEITLMRPGVKPAIADLKPGVTKMPVISGQIADGEVHVKTSGLTFDQKSGVATTAKRVDFALKQGGGNSVGATFDSTLGQLVLDHAVELHMNSAGAKIGEPVTLHASHAEFDRKEQVGHLTQALAEYSGGTAQVGVALLHFRDDGSLIRLDGSGGVVLVTAAESHLTAPRGSLDFDEDNHPRHGLLEGGAQLDSSSPGRQMHGSSPTAKLSFDAAGQLRQAHLEQGVQFESQQQGSARNAATQSKRTWRSQIADIEFAAAPVVAKAVAKSDSSPPQSRLSARTEARTIRGYGGVVITSNTVGGSAAGASKLSADTVIAQLAPGGSLASLNGTGHASFVQRTAAGVHQTSTSDQLEIRMATASKGRPEAMANEIASVIQTGHVVLSQDASPGKTGKAGAAGLRATADQADYDGPSQLLHLSGTPRIQDGELDLAATRIDFARATGDAFAHGEVKASWSGSSAKSASLPGATLLAGSSGSNGSAGNGPIHAIAAEAEMRRTTGEVIFRGTNSSGNQPRLWQAANSIAAPVITLNRLKQTLTAISSSAANPVKTVLVRAASTKQTKGHPEAPSVIRLRSGELRYSEGERLAILKAGSAGSVTAETTESGGPATVNSQETEVRLLPVGVHSASGGTGVDQMTARGHVTVDWPGRRGTGEKLVYQSEDGTFTLTGTSTARPRITDQMRGNVSGAALIFHSRDDSVTVEGDGGKTVTETQSPK